jgi:hypothetical protein
MVFSKSVLLFALLALFLYSVSFYTRHGTQNVTSATKSTIPPRQVYHNQARKSRVSTLGYKQAIKIQTRNEMIQARKQQQGTNTCQTISQTRSCQECQDTCAVCTSGPFNPLSLSTCLALYCSRQCASPVLCPAAIQTRDCSQCMSECQTCSQSSQGNLTSALCMNLYCPSNCNRIVFRTEFANVPSRENISPYYGTLNYMCSRSALEENAVTTREILPFIGDAVTYEPVVCRGLDRLIMTMYVPLLIGRYDVYCRHTIPLEANARNITGMRVEAADFGCRFYVRGANTNQWELECTKIIPRNVPPQPDGGPCV